MGPLLPLYLLVQVGRESMQLGSTARWNREFHRRGQGGALSVFDLRVGPEPNRRHSGLPARALRLLAALWCGARTLLIWSVKECLRLLRHPPQWSECLSGFRKKAPAPCKFFGQSRTASSPPMAIGSDDILSRAVPRFLSRTTGSPSGDQWPPDHLPQP